MVVPLRERGRSIGKGLRRVNRLSVAMEAGSGYGHKCQFCRRLRHGCGWLRFGFESLRHVYAEQAFIYAIIRYLDPTAGEHNE